MHTRSKYLIVILGDIRISQLKYYEIKVLFHFANTNRSYDI